MKKAGKWDGVFRSHPGVTEIYVGTNADGHSQPFLKMGDAVSFAGDSSRVEIVNKDGSKSPADPPTVPSTNNETLPPAAVNKPLPQATGTVETDSPKGKKKK